MKQIGDLNQKSNWQTKPPFPAKDLTFSKIVFVTNGKRIGFGYYNHAIGQWRTFSLDGDVVAWHDLEYPELPVEGQI